MFKVYSKIILISIIIALYLFEFCASLKINDYLFLNILKYTFSGNKFDLRTKFQYYNENKKKFSIQTFPANFLNNDKINIFPLSALSKKKLVHCNENGYMSFIDTDRYGFNNPDYVWDLDETEILLIGDSKTHGACVNRPNDIASVLRKKLDKNVINLGMGGAGSLQELATLKEYIPKKTKKILWFYNSQNDLKDLQKELKNKFLLNYFNYNYKQNLKFKQNQVDHILEEFILKSLNSFQHKDNKYQLDLINLIKLNHIRSQFKLFYFEKNKKFSQNDSEDLKTLASLEKILNISSQFAKEKGAELYFIFLPSYDHFIPYNKGGDIFHSDKVINIAKKLNLKIIDFSEDIKKLKDPFKLYPFKSSGHYSPYGYEYLANSILNKLN